MSDSDSGTTRTNQYSDEELLAYLTVYTDIFGVPPRVKDLDELAGPCGSLYGKRFDSYEDALKRAGVHPEVRAGGER